MKKQVKKYGNTLIINFDKEEARLYHIEEGKIYDIELVEVKDG